MAERRLGTQTVFQGDFIHVHVDEVENEDGHRSSREVVDTKGAAAIVCIDGDDLVLVRQHRYPAGETFIEIPAGLIDAGESAEQTAARELVEEVGLRARTLEHLVRYYAAPGFANHRIDIFFTDDVEPAEQSLDEGEVLEVVRRPVESIREMLASGELSDAKTLIGLSLVALRH